MVFWLKCPPLLIGPWTWLVDAHKNKKVPKRSEHIWAKIGQNWQKSAIWVMRILSTRARRRARGLIFSAFHRNRNYTGVCRKSHQDPADGCLVIWWKPFPHWAPCFDHALLFSNLWKSYWFTYTHNRLIGIWTCLCKEGVPKKRLSKCCWSQSASA